MRHVSNVDCYSRLVPSAAGMFSYIRQHLTLRKMELEFEYGVVADDAGMRAVAKFCCHGCVLCNGSVVWVSAIPNERGWKFSHSIGPIL